MIKTQTIESVRFNLVTKNDSSNPLLPKTLFGIRVTRLEDGKECHEDFYPDPEHREMLSRMLLLARNIDNHIQSDVVEMANRISDKSIVNLFKILALENVIERQAISTYDSDGEAPAHVIEAREKLCDAILSIGAVSALSTDNHADKPSDNEEFEECKLVRLIFTRAVMSKLMGYDSELIGVKAQLDFTVFTESKFIREDILPYSASELYDTPEVFSKK